MITDYIERWATIFREISHVPNGTPDEKRFYRVPSLFSGASFCANLTHAQSPCVAVVTQNDPKTSPDGRFWLWTHRIFIYVRQEGRFVQNAPTEEEAATAAKQKGIEIAQKLVAYMHADRRGRLPSGAPPNPQMEGLEDRATVINEPAMYNGWWPTEVILYQAVPRDRCVCPNDYNPH